MIPLNRVERERPHKRRADVTLGNFAGSITPPRYLKPKKKNGMDLNRIIELSEKHSLTEEEKEEIRNAANEAEIEVRFGGKCPNCYNDALVMLRSKFAAANKPTDRKWKYLRDSSQIWNGHIIDGNTPDEIVDEFVKLFPQFFELNQKPE